MIKIALAVVVLAHGIGHILFLVPLLGIAEWGQSARSWLLGADTPAKLIGGLLWLVALIGFCAAAFGLFSQQEWWRPVAIISSAVSLVGLLLFWANPASSSAVSAAVVDLLVPIALLVIRWPSVELIGA